MQAKSPGHKVHFSHMYILAEFWHFEVQSFYSKNIFVIKSADFCFGQRLFRVKKVKMVNRPVIDFFIYINGPGE